MNCTNCGAPLPAASNICTFCETLNDTDLRAIGIRGAGADASNRTCPGCAQTLVHINIGQAKPLFIDRCPECLGIFFDNGELEAALHDNVSNVFDVDYRRLKQLNEHERRISAATDEVRYVKCPICRDLMHRRAYGARSGVIIDSCRAHGVWLDAGELGHLLKWVKAGGKKLQKQRREQEQRDAERERRVRVRPPDTGNFDSPMHAGGDSLFSPAYIPLLYVIMRLLAKLLIR